jgi:hypothetical protein
MDRIGVGLKQIPYLGNDTLVFGPGHYQLISVAHDLADQFAPEVVEALVVKCSENSLRSLYTIKSEVCLFFAKEGEWDTHRLERLH